MRIKFKTGDVFQIPLPKGLGFAYAKYINLLDINPNLSYPDLIKIYNYRTLKHDFDISEIENSTLLFSPLLVG